MGFGAMKYWIRAYKRRASGAANFGCCRWKKEILLLYPAFSLSKLPLLFAPSSLLLTTHSLALSLAGIAPASLAKSAILGVPVGI
jgi:hypothetical protein